MSLRIVQAARPALRVPTVMFGRHYSPDVRPEGTTGSSKGFSQREQAEEGQYIKRKELEKLRESQKKLEEFQKKHPELAGAPEKKEK